jgi:hypothetical protein
MHAGHKADAWDADERKEDQAQLDAWDKRWVVEDRQVDRPK